MLTLSSVYRTFWFVQDCTYCCGLSACRHLCTLFQLQPECARRCSLAPITNVLLFPSCVQAKVLLPFLSDPLPFLSFYFLFLYMDNWSKSLEILNKWMVCYTGFPLGSFAEGNIYSKGTWTFKCHGWQCWLFRESCSAGMLNSWEGDVGFNLWLPRTGDMVVKRLKDAAAPRPNVVRSMKDLFLINSEPANELLL